MITSSSNREYTVASPDGDVQTRSYQLRQTITYQSCRHGEASGPATSTQQLSVDHVFVMFEADNRLIRYAMSNKIGSIHSESGTLQHRGGGTKTTNGMFEQRNIKKLRN